MDEYDYLNDENEQKQQGSSSAHNQTGLVGWLPPGADCSSNKDLFGKGLDEHFWLPNRLADKSQALVEAVNDFHYAMMNDFERNVFYQKALEKVVNDKSVVLEIGTGSGLLAMLSSKAGAKQVYAIEANRHMCQLAKINMENNDLKNIKVINKLSTEAQHPADVPEKANILISEIIGTLLLGESALEYVANVRNRLLTDDAVIIPAGGRQFIELIQCEQIEDITSVSKWGGLDLSAMNVLQDTVSTVFTKQYGFRLNTVNYESIVPRTCVADIDFYKHNPGDLPLHQKIPVKALKKGKVHAVLMYWEAYADRERTIAMSTDPKETVNNFARDLQWGQALQLVEERSDDDGSNDQPRPFMVEEGEELVLEVSFSEDSAVLQVCVTRSDID
mmetsp:Transcript_36736/g.57707  ORF Transcript_36736/g.57707 Transcript_36736/m.57707 type:complete len:389 (-) Transcript_36736:61-1227(-)|eukprot:CAMPEP_0201510412 /NCGR_PEP_ID=MMETSP0161_2-20130828/3112_1 /ASSEMBLY_ACC=CAM_ASM_000251 /TAXON_ID=180227 /ORGANISM="Neoparamoeba aestuarina, Strain SoJaBio B1-5/56/2" /LENGTH=388 /DNA_ID=CAMNT_0047905579 /DNA_START=65 /DNA_END=1231 /DNA_ORIENTATION=-